MPLFLSLNMNKNPLMIKISDFPHLGAQYITEFSYLHREDVNRNEDGESDVFTE